MTNAALREYIATEIKVAMVRKNVTQRELADALHMSKSTLSHRLTGRVAFSLEDLDLVCGVLGVEIADLLPEDHLTA